MADGKLAHNITKDGDLMLQYKEKAICDSCGPISYRAEIYQTSDLITYFETRHCFLLGCCVRCDGCSSVSSAQMVKDKISSFDFIPSSVGKCARILTCRCWPCCPTYKYLNVYSSSGALYPLVIDAANYDSALELFRTVSGKEPVVQQRMM